MLPYFIFVCVFGPFLLKRFVFTRSVWPKKQKESETLNGGLIKLRSLVWMEFYSARLVRRRHFHTWQSWFGASDRSKPLKQPAAVVHMVAAENQTGRVLWLQTCRFGLIMCPLVSQSRYWSDRGERCGEGWGGVPAVFSEDFAHRKRSWESPDRGRAAAAPHPEPDYLTGTAVRPLHTGNRVWRELKTKIKVSLSTPRHRHCDLWPPSAARTFVFFPPKQKSFVWIKSRNMLN